MKDKLGAAAACLLFAVCFGGVGVFATWMIAATVYDGYRAKEWVKVKATVDSWKGSNIDYRYTIGGREYRGDRLGTLAIGGSSEVDGWDGEMNDLVSTAFNEKKPLTVFVNPDNPTESMVDRTIRWKLLVFFLPFSLAFGGVGVGALWMLFRTFVPARPKAAKESSGLAGLWIFTFFWNAISFPIAYLFVPQIIEEGEWVGLFVLLFPLIGTLMLWGAIAGTYRYLRYGYVQPPATLSPALPQGGGRKAKPKMVETMEEFTEQAKAFVREDDMRTASLGPDMRSVEEMLNGAGIKMTAKQAEVLKQLTPSQRQNIDKAATVARHIPWRKVVIGAVVLYVVWQLGTIAYAVWQTWE